MRFLRGLGEVRFKGRSVEEKGAASGVRQRCGSILGLRSGNDNIGPTSLFESTDWKRIVHSRDRLSRGKEAFHGEIFIPRGEQRAGSFGPRPESSPTYLCRPVLLERTDNRLVLLPAFDVHDHAHVRGVNNIVGAIGTGGEQDSVILAVISHRPLAIMNT